MRAAAVAVVVGWSVMAAQELQLGSLDRASKAKRQHVELLTDAVELHGRKPQEVELRFRVEPGFHINSHTPKDELLIPTVLTLDAADGLKILGESYPSGSAFRLPIGKGETLDVYQDEFRVRLRMVARGDRTLSGVLRYQACDNAACFPARTLPVRVAVTAR
jgi:hypothetical protein